MHYCTVLPNNCLLYSATVVLVSCRDCAAVLHLWLGCIYALHISWVVIRQRHRATKAEASHPSLVSTKALGLGPQVHFSWAVIRQKLYLVCQYCRCMS